MRNWARNQMKLFPESDLFGVVPKIIKNYNFCGDSLLDPRSISPEKLNFASLFPEILDLPTFHLSCFLDRFVSTFSNINHSVEFRDLKISTKNSPCELFWDVQYMISVWLSVWFRLEAKCVPILSGFQILDLGGTLCHSKGFPELPAGSNEWVYWPLGNAEILIVRPNEWTCILIVRLRRNLYLACG